MRHHIRKKSFHLLELLVALMLVAICFYPLLKPHVSICKIEYERLEKMELQRISREAFVMFKEKLYENKIFSWKELNNQGELVYDSEPIKVTTSEGKEYFPTFILKKRERSTEKSKGISYLLCHVTVGFPNKKQPRFEYGLLIRGDH